MQLPIASEPPATEHLFRISIFARRYTEPVTKLVNDRGLKIGTEVIFQALTAAADVAGISVCVTMFSESDAHGVEVLYVNEALQRLLGRDRTELQAIDLWSVFPQEEASRLQANRSQRRRGEAALDSFETAVFDVTGQRIPVELSTSRVTVDGRQINVSFMFDLRQRKAADEALLRSEARFRSLIEHAPDGITILRWPTILYTNQKAAHMLGFDSPQESIGVDITTLLQPAAVPNANQRAKLTLEGRQQVPSEYRRINRDGSVLTIDLSTVMIDYDGAPAILGFARDVTDRSAMLAQLMQADKVAAIGTLAAGVAHEINNPLAYLLLNLEFLERELPRLVGDASRLDAALERLQETKQGAERVKTIVRDLQVFTRKDDGFRGPVDLASVLDSSLELSRHRVAHRATVTKNLCEMPRVDGNVTRFQQLFVNLLLNASQAFGERDAHDNQISIATRRDPDGRVIVTVRDNGAGMSEQVRRRVFDPFFTTKPTGAGTGLGLPICLGIVQGVGGEISIESELDVGTTVTVKLQPQHANMPSQTLPAANPVASNLPRARLLIVDDELAVASSLAAALSEDYDVVTVGGAKAARAALADDQEFDLVLCDLMMQGESGMHLFEHVRQTRPELARRFAFMSGGTFQPEAEQFLRTFKNPYIDKPFDLRSMRDLIETALLHR